MQRRTSSGLLWAGWILLVGGYAVISLAFPPGPTRTAFGDAGQCLAALFAVSGLLLNAASADWRRNSFWMLTALGCALWMIGQALWTYVEVVMHRPIPNPFFGDVIFFVHVVPMIAALALQPHAEQYEKPLAFGRVDFTLLLLWWVYLYAFFVIPWQYIASNDLLYGQSYNFLLGSENAILLFGLGVLYLRTRGRWRVIYGHLFLASLLYNLSATAINRAIDVNSYSTGSLYDVPLVAAFVWYGAAGIVALRLGEGRAPAPCRRSSEQPWRAKLATAAALSLPALAFWQMFDNSAPPKVWRFRMELTICGIVVLTILVFLRHYLMDRERLRLLAASRDAFQNLRHLQTQLVQSAKLASLGRLVAGAAHEINNPLAAILGYSELLIDNAALREEHRTIAQKIRLQARRTRTLVSDLLSFARQVPAEKIAVDVNAAIRSALQLRALDLRQQHIRIAMETDPHLPPVRGDSNQLVQVFFNLISNSVDALEEAGGVLTLRTARAGSMIIAEVLDTGPGLAEPDLVFDPFYTTKAVGKGTGLGLSICYGIVQEHGGRISCHNRPAGGAAFRIEIPVALSAATLLGAGRLFESAAVQAPPLMAEAPLEHEFERATAAELTGHNGSNQTSEGACFDPLIRHPQDGIDGRQPHRVPHKATETKER